MSETKDINISLAREKGLKEIALEQRDEAREIAEQFRYRIGKGARDIDHSLLPWKSDRKLKIRLEVVEYFESGNWHLCLDGSGNKHRVDLMVNGDFREDMDPKELVGRIVEVGSLYTYLSLGLNVELIDIANAGSPPARSE